MKSKKPLPPREPILQPPRSPKAGRPPATAAVPPQARRRQRTARAAVKKGTTILQAAEGPRVVCGVMKPKVKKR
jgi:hypothetical protein